MARPIAISKMSQLTGSTLCVLLFSLLHSAPTQAQSSNIDQLDSLIACRIIDNAEARLSCFDQNSALLDDAQKSGDVVVVTKEDVVKAERDSFGLRASEVTPLDQLVRGIVPSQNSDQSSQQNQGSVSAKQNGREETIGRVAKSELADNDEIREISIPIDRVDTFGYQRKRFYLTNGQVWEQTTSQNVRVPKQREGQPPNFVEIQKASIGGFFLRVNGTGRAIRAHRVR